MSVTLKSGNDEYELTSLIDLLAGEDLANDVLKTEQRFSYLNIVLAAPTTTVVKSGVGFLHAITINKDAASLLKEVQALVESVA